MSQPLGSQYDGLWVDSSTFRIDVHNAWLPQPQVNGTFTTRVWLRGSAPLFSADRSGMHEQASNPHIRRSNRVEPMREPCEWPEKTPCDDPHHGLEAEAEWQEATSAARL